MNSPEPVQPFLRRHFAAFLFAAEFLLAAVLLFSARREGLLGMPRPGMDQYTILEAALGIARGVLPVPGTYLYSPAYTLFLGGLAFLSGGNLTVMRLLQAGICAWIPAQVYRTSRRAGVSRTGAELAGVFYLFCGSALLISLEFLRAAPLALCTVLWFDFLLKSQRDRRMLIPAGVMAGLCMLGRENFIPVVFLPLMYFMLPQVCRSRGRDFRGVLLYAGAALLTLSPVLLYNFMHTGSLAILPGNGRNVLEFMQGKGMASAPGAAAAAILAKTPHTVWTMIAPFEIPNSLSFYAFREAIPFLKVLCMPITLLFALGAIGIAGRYRNRALLLCGVIVTAYFGTLIFCEIYYRFRIPVLPLLSLAAGAGAAELIRWGRERQGKRLLPALLVLLAATLTLRQAPETQLPQSERDATVRFLADRQRYEEAARLLLRYRRCGVPSPAGERFLLRSAARTGNAELLQRLAETLRGE